MTRVGLERTRERNGRSRPPLPERPARFPALTRASQIPVFALAAWGTLRPDRDCASCAHEQAERGPGRSTHAPSDRRRAHRPGQAGARRQRRAAAGDAPGRARPTRSDVLATTSTESARPTPATSRLLVVSVHWHSRLLLVHLTAARCGAGQSRCRVGQNACAPSSRGSSASPAARSPPPAPSPSPGTPSRSVSGTPCSGRSRRVLER